MRNAGLDETQARIKVAGRNINNLRCADDTTLMAESEEELKSLLMKVKEESEKAGLTLNRASLVAQRLKRLPLMRETWVRSLGQEDPLEKEMETHSRTLAWKISWTEEPGGLQSLGSQRVARD